MTRRRLRPDELDLWQQVAKTAERLHPEKQVSSPTLSKPGVQKISTPRIEKFELGQKTDRKQPRNDVLPGLPERIAAAPVKMDKKAFVRLKRGKLVPEGKIDLHGMTIDRAHPALTGFILRSHSEGKRLVLVITGKGKERDDGGPIPVRPGILRHNVPRWLSLPPLAPVVLQISEAHLKHGGGGAYYIYLRRHR